MMYSPQTQLLRYITAIGMIEKWPHRIIQQAVAIQRDVNKLRVDRLDLPWFVLASARRKGIKVWSGVDRPWGTHKSLWGTHD